jgi:hypothetical protein
MPRLLLRSRAPSGTGRLPGWTRSSRDLTVAALFGVATESALFVPNYLVATDLVRKAASLVADFADAWRPNCVGVVRRNTPSFIGAAPALIVGNGIVFIIQAGLFSLAVLGIM